MRARSPRAAVRVSTPLVAAVVALCAAAPASCQVVRSARVVADFTRGDGSASVEIEYVLERLGDTVSVPVSLLDFGGAAAADIRVGAQETPVDVPVVHGVARGGTLRVDRVAGDGGVTVRYRVPAGVSRDGGALRGHVPVLTVDLPPDEASPGLFQAELHLPPQWTVSEGFPTALAATGEPGVYHVTLPVVPSVVSFRARSDGQWRPGLSLVLDVLGVSILVVFSLVGWRHLQEPWT